VIQELQKRIWVSDQTRRQSYNGNILQSLPYKRQNNEEKTLNEYYRLTFYVDGVKINNIVVEDQNQNQNQNSNSNQNQMTERKKEYFTMLLPVRKHHSSELYQWFPCASFFWTGDFGSRCELRFPTHIPSLEDIYDENNSWEK